MTNQSHPTYSELDNVVHVPELHLGPRGLYTGPAMLAALRETLDCFRRGIRFELKWKFEVIKHLEINDHYLLVKDARFPAFDEILNAYPIDAVLLGKVAAGNLLRFFAYTSLARGGEFDGQLTILQYSTLTRRYDLIQSGQAQPTEALFVRWL